MHQQHRVEFFHRCFASEGHTCNPAAAAAAARASCTKSRSRRGRPTHFQTQKRPDTSASSLSLTSAYCSPTPNLVLGNENATASSMDDYATTPHNYMRVLGGGGAQ